MFFYTIKAICISLLLIALIHYLYAFFKDTLTIPKIKDLVNKPAKRYNEMFDILSNSKIQGGEQSMQSQSMQSQSMQSQSMQSQSMQSQSMQSQSMQSQSMQSQSMQEELKTFLNELKKPNENKFNNKNMHFSAANDNMSGPYSQF
jgi:hypothetical protein